MARFGLHDSIFKNLCGSILNKLAGSIPTHLAGSLLTSLPGSVSKNVTGSILKKISIAGCVLAFAWSQNAVAQAPRGGGHIGGGGHVGGGVRVSAPPRAPISQPRVFVPSRGVGPRGAGLRGTGPRLAGVGRLTGSGGFVFRQGPIQVFRSRQFFGVPIFKFGAGWAFNSLWWPTCGPSLGWAWGGGFDCSPVPFYGYGFENYVTLPTYESPMYLYGGGERDLIWLYLKDGTVYGVTDYWLVDGQMHFSAVEDDPTKPAEHVFPFDELDLQKTTYVNTHRGFRIVFRDEPWQQYLKDHPDLTPPDLPHAQKN
jgi:hypothetical protein